MPVLDLVYNPFSGSFRQQRLTALVAALEREGFAVNPLPSRIDGIDLSGKAELV